MCSDCFLFSEHSSHIRSSPIPFAIHQIEGLSTNCIYVLLVYSNCFGQVFAFRNRHLFVYFPKLFLVFKISFQVPFKYQCTCYCYASNEENVQVIFITLQSISPTCTSSLFQTFIIIQQTITSKIILNLQHSLLPLYITNKLKQIVFCSEKVLRISSNNQILVLIIKSNILSDIII